MGRPGWSAAYLARVAVIDGELLVELEPIGDGGSLLPGSEVMWLCGRVDRTQITAAVTRCRSSDPVHFLEAEPGRVVLDVGALTIPLVHPNGDGGTFDP